MSRRQTIIAGPWRGVRSTTDPFDDSPDFLVDAQNLYIPDPVGGSSAFARPGCSLENTSSALAGQGQAIHHHVALDGTEYNFSVSGGKVYRADANQTTFTDVTPTGVPISTTHRVFAATFADKLLVTDGVNPPWYGTNLSSTPITATTINYVASAGTLLSRGADPKLHTAQFSYNVDTTYANQAATDITATGNGLTISAGNKWGAARVSIAANGTITVTWTPLGTYSTEALAIAALPAVPAASFDMGYVTVSSQVAASWIAGTDSFTGGASGNVAATTNYYAPRFTNPWNAYGPPAIYAGHAFFVLGKWTNSTTITNARTSIAWSEANDPSLGYEQTNYDNTWTISQTSADPLYGLVATNVYLYYFRRNSIGAIAGNPGVGAGMRTSATNDQVSPDIGTTAPATIRLYGETVYFADALGRPHRFRYGSAPEPIWLNMRQYVDTSLATAGMASALELTGVAAIEPTFRLYLVGSYSAQPSSNASPTTLYAFDAASGAYVGRWSIGAGMLVDAIGVQRDANQRPVLTVIGSKVAGVGQTSGFVWILNGLDAGVWTDNGVVPTITAQTQRLGYSADTTLYADQVRAIVGSTAPCTVTVETPFTASTLECTPTPTSSSDGRSRLVGGLDIQGRGIQVTLSPTTATSQWALDRIEIDAVPSRALPDEY